MLCLYESGGMRCDALCGSLCDAIVGLCDVAFELDAGRADARLLVTCDGLESGFDKFVVGRADCLLNLVCSLSGFIRGCGTDTPDGFFVSVYVPSSGLDGICTSELRSSCSFEFV